MAGKFKKSLRFAVWLLTFLFLTGMAAGCAGSISSATQQAAAAEPYAKRSAEAVPEEDGSYTSKEEVALYLHTYGHLPDNYISKKEAQALGWESKKGNLDDGLIFYTEDHYKTFEQLY